MEAPHPDNLSLRAGVLRFDRFVNGVPQGYKHLGNVESLEVTSNITELDKKNSMDGARATYKKVITAIEVLANITFNEQTDFNVALLVLGLSAALVQPADAAIVDEDVNEGDALKLGNWYRLTLGAAPPVEVFYPTVSAVKQGVTTLVLGQDYEVDAHAGMIKLIDDIASDAIEAPATWSGSVPAVDAKQIHALATPRIEGRLHYRTASNLVTGPQEEITFHKVSIRPEGAFQLISEEFAAPVLQATVETDLSKPVGEQYYKYVQTGNLPAPEGS